MKLDEEEIKTIKDMLEELVDHRKSEDDKRSTDENGLYEDEARLAEKLGIQLSPTE